MSKYTVQLRRLCDVFGRDTIESWFKRWDLSDYLTADEIETINRRDTFSKDKLAEQIVDFYFMREIGFETPALFKTHCMIRMREIMGKYSQLIYSASIKIDPLVNEDYIESFTRDVATEGKSDTSSEGSGFGITSDTPQSELTKSDLLSGKYASGATGDETTTSGQTNASGSEKETYTRSVKGNRGITSNAPYLIKQYRNIILDIYGEIINECANLFMLIY